jgi:hypothetical protein
MKMFQHVSQISTWIIDGTKSLMMTTKEDVGALKEKAKRRNKS